MKRICFTMLGVFSAVSFAEAPVAPAPRAIQIVHSSIGAGINGAAAEAIRSVLGSQLAKGTLVKYSVQPNGLEGETIGCAEFSDAAQTLKVTEILKQIAPQDTRIAINSATVCR